jgi:hypothetical protein
MFPGKENEMDVAESFHEVVRIAQSADEPLAAWHVLTKYLQQSSRVDLTELAAVDLRADVEQVQLQLIELIQQEPPPRDINALYFGLFDTIDEDDDRGRTCRLGAPREQKHD